ncbi:hypothetical protein MPER_09214 [Moniliophthora perniciosa FA553]|nr:hypothetical protein MPER_09214 [Moniliophthora perniciosa FA553]
MPDYFSFPSHNVPLRTVQVTVMTLSFIARAPPSGQALQSMDCNPS